MKTQSDLVVVVPFEAQSCFPKLFRCGCLIFPPSQWCSSCLWILYPILLSKPVPFITESALPSSPESPSLSFLFIFNNINLLFPLLHSAVISSFYMQPGFLFEAMISLPLMRTLPKTFTPTFQCIHPTMHPRKSSNYSIPMWLCTPSILFLQNFKVNRLNKKNHNNNDKNE